MTGPREFTRAGILDAVTKLIATNNQVNFYVYLSMTTMIITHLFQPIALADNTKFRNALVSMRPKSTTADLPTAYTVKIHLHNEFVKHMKELKQEIMVSHNFQTLNDSI
jgi:hypothetical protein